MASDLRSGMGVPSEKHEKALPVWKSEAEPVEYGLAAEPEDQDFLKRR